MTETGYFRVIIDKKDEQIEQQQGTITDLQKENAELKKTIEHYRKEREFFISEVEK